MTPVELIAFHIYLEGKSFWHTEFYFKNVEKSCLKMFLVSAQFLSLGVSGLF